MPHLSIHTAGRVYSHCDSMDRDKQTSKSKQLSKLLQKMLKLLQCSVKISETNVYLARGFYSSAPLLGKATIRQTWKRNAERFLKRTEHILSGKASAKNKYAR